MIYIDKLKKEVGTRELFFIEKLSINQDETVALLSKLDVDKHISVKIQLDLTSAESKAKYKQIKKMYCLDDRSAE